MTTVRQHERQKPRKPDAYIERHLNLIERRADRIAFLKRHGIKLIGANDSRLAKPIADPVPGPGNMPIEEHKSLLKTLATMLGVK